MKDFAEYYDFVDDEESMMHYGMPRRSGRYPWGSGDDPYQGQNGPSSARDFMVGSSFDDGKDFLARIDILKEAGWKETPKNIMTEFGMTTTQYRKEHSLAVARRTARNHDTVRSLRDDGKTPSEIAREMGVNESTVRSWIAAIDRTKTTKVQELANTIRDQVNQKKIIDIGSHIESELGVSRVKFDAAIEMLRQEGYEVYGNRMPQVTNPGKTIRQKVLCVPGTEQKDTYDWGNIHSLNEYTSDDDGTTLRKFVYPASMDSKRLQIKYAEEGGIDKDGLIEIRPGVPDLSLGDARYSQVRILVDDKKYLKGMAVYSNDLPEGIDVRFNTNKTKEQGYNKALKDIKTEDPENPFGSSIAPKGQSYYIDPKTGEKKLSLINKRADEGDWSEWSGGLPSQFLSKQSRILAKQQLQLAKDAKKKEYDEIMDITNPVIKKYYLQKFAESCDSDAVDLKAASLPGQKYHVIIPVNTLKDDEVYAPNYPDGSKLALIRYPHGGIFEIPILTVNNKNKNAMDILGKDSGDALCINKANADRLSGADFDGDTLNIIFLINKDIVENAEEIFNPRNNMMISHNDGRFNNKFNHERDTLVLTNALRNINLNKYTPEQLEKIHNVKVIGESTTVV